MNLATMPKEGTWTYDGVTTLQVIGPGDSLIESGEIRSKSTSEVKLLGNGTYQVVNVIHSITRRTGGKLTQQEVAALQAHVGKLHTITYNKNRHLINDKGSESLTYDFAVPDRVGIGDSWDGAVLYHGERFPAKFKLEGHERFAGMDCVRISVSCTYFDRRMPTGQVKCVLLDIYWMEISSGAMVEEDTDLTFDYGGDRMIRMKSRQASFQPKVFEAHSQR